MIQNLVGKPKWKRSFGGPCCRWEDNIGNHVKTSSAEDVDWIQLPQVGVERRIREGGMSYKRADRKKDIVSWTWVV
jgi:hypothetical protein